MSALGGVPAVEGRLGPSLTPIEVTATDGPARVGVVRTPRGAIRTPCFMPVGTRGAVRTLSSADLDDLEVQVMLANTYHLMLRPGADLVAQMGGLHRFTAWDGHILTDSGGFQIFSLAPKVDDDGVTFRSTYDGDEHRFTPEAAVAVQQQLGADIQMVLDVCPPLPSSPSVIRSAVDRTADWAARAVAAMAPAREAGSTQALFGIVQGGADPAMRIESARRTVALGFDGHGIGGFSVGEEREAMLPALAATLAELPADRPRYLMGVGDPRGLVEAIALGVDMFDCVLPSRFARHGTILTSAGRYNLRAGAHATSDDPLDPDCGCAVCERWSRAYVRHLLRVKEPTAARLCTIHNIAWLTRLVDRARDAVERGTTQDLVAEVAAVWP